MHSSRLFWVGPSPTDQRPPMLLGLHRRICVRGLHQITRRSLPIAWAATSADLSGPDLTRWAPPSDLWSQPQRWVVFSDLHVSPRTRGVCLEVLRRVEEEANARAAGVLFLGVGGRE
jgi:hypothetical protein